VESREVDKDYRNYQNCLEALMQNSSNAKVFCLVHKMDLIQEEMREKVFHDKENDIMRTSDAISSRQRASTQVQCFRSSIWDETLYKAWSAIVYQLIPNVGSMENKLKQLAEIMDADEVYIVLPDASLQTLQKIFGYVTIRCKSFGDVLSDVTCLAEKSC
jgi:Ras-related GTP-binding protein A/B